MATLADPEPPTLRRRKSCARGWERCCCAVIQYFPLAFIYGLTSWAVWVEVNIGLLPDWRWPALGRALAIVGFLIYALLNWSYTTAVFTDPGSTVDTKPGYSALPTSEPRPYTSFTVKSTGDIRFCKKCQAKKPDRAHHCSTCRRCVLKMDHHCPWLATCVGLRNYKAFILFLVYTSLFCWVCFGVSAMWIWAEVIVKGSVEESLMPVHYILLAVLSGIIGLVISAFTGWHIYLATNGITTIESLEKTRYLSPLRQQLSTQLHPQRTYVNGEHHTIGEQLRDLGDALTEIHVNALPGVLRPEEGEDRLSPSPAHSSLQRHLHNEYAQQERQRDRDRYSNYLDELDSEKLPNAFDLGWRRNLISVLGPTPMLWWLPINGSAGDGWNWEPSPKWLEARDQIKMRREDEVRRQQNGEGSESFSIHGADLTGQGPSPNGQQHMVGRRSPARTPRGQNKADRILGRTPGQTVDGTDWDLESRRKSTPLRSLRAYSNGDGMDRSDESSDDETLDDRTRLLRADGVNVSSNWNDIPEDFLDSNAPRKGGTGGRKNR